MRINGEYLRDRSRYFAIRNVLKELFASEALGGADVAEKPKDAWIQSGKSIKAKDA